MLDYKIHPWRKELKITKLSEANEEFIVISDPLGIAAQAIQMPAALWESLQFLNVEGINEKIESGEFTFEIDMEQLRTVIYNLDIMGFLDSPRTKVLGKEASDYLNSPTREAICSESVYPSDRKSLSQKIDQIIQLSEYAPDTNKKPKSILAPHLDYNTGLATLKVYAEAFKPLIGHSYSRVMLIGTSHYANSNMLMLCDKDYLTPLGTAKLDRETTLKISEHTLASIDNLAHKNEHSLELHLPFLQKILGEDTQYTFALTGIIDKEKKYKDEDLDSLLTLLSSFNDENTLFVFSGDLTHIGKKFGDDLAALELKEENEQFLHHTVRTLSQNDAEAFFDWVYPQNSRFKVCGLSPFYIALKLQQNYDLLNATPFVTWEEYETESSVSIVSMVYG